MGKSRVTFVAALVLLMGVLWVSPALAGGAGGLLGGGGGFGALTSVKNLISQNIATVASIAVLGIGMLLAFSKSSWMELVGSLAFIATVGITISWASSNTGTFFGSGGLLP